MPTKKEAIEALKNKGFRMTQIRETLIGFLMDQKGHWHVQDMGERVTKKYPNIGIATVYRTVNLLADEGFLTKTDMGTGPARYEVMPQDHHDHLTCLDCGLIFEFENEKIEELQKKVSSQLGFKLANHTMELYGHCKDLPDCKKKAEK